MAHYDRSRLLNARRLLPQAHYGALLIHGQQKHVLTAGDALLVKASHGMALEKVLEIFYAEQKDAEE